MAIRLLGGQARGFVLQTPPESITRPTAILLKRRLFDWRQDWTDLGFVDLCAGSGSMGLEALSRGAARVWLNELNRTAHRVLEKNVAEFRRKHALAGDQELRLTQLDFRKVLPQLAGTAWDAPGVVVYFDPPYEAHELYAQFWDAVRGLACEVWVESDDLKGVPRTDQRQHLSSLVKEVVQGSHWVLAGKPLSR